LGLLDIAGIAFRALQRKDRIEALVERWVKVAPVATALVMNVFKPLVQETLALAREIVPSLGAPAPTYSVSWVQTQLNRLGEHLTVDGHQGPDTRAAIARFQAANGLVVDEMAGLETCSLLDAKTEALP
jgi:hypothetical protein